MVWEIRRFSLKKKLLVVVLFVFLYWYFVCLLLSFFVWMFVLTYFFNQYVPSSFVRLLYLSVSNGNDLITLIRLSLISKLLNYLSACTQNWSFVLQLFYSPPSIDDPPKWNLLRNNIECPYSKPDYEKAKEEDNPVMKWSVQIIRKSYNVR